tara:strand:+ start:95 stop:271 length:177 start_codon:yes stop_codon:yes gene_type:complete
MKSYGKHELLKKILRDPQASKDLDKIAFGMSRSSIEIEKPKIRFSDGKQYSIKIIDKY